VGDPLHIEERYGVPAYRYILFKARHIAQNLFLLGAAYGVCVQATGGFFGRCIRPTFGLDGMGRRLLYLVAVGGSQL
jgi:hypothetical protein